MHPMCPMRLMRPMRPMPIVDRIERKLADALTPARLATVDQSHLHAGRAGARPAGESHFRVEIVSGAFEGKSRLARRRMVYAVLAEELAGPVRALELGTRTQSDDRADA